MFYVREPTHAMSEIITNVAPARAAQWFGVVLSDAEIPCCFELLGRLTDLNLQVLNVKQLKAISKALFYRSTAYHTFTYTPPRSGAKKAEWIYAIGAFFHAHGSNNAVYDVLNDTPIDDMLPAAESTKFTPTNVANARPSSHASITANAYKSSEVSTISSTAGMVAANSLQCGSNQTLGGQQSTVGVATTGVVAASINVNETINPDTGLIRPAIHVKREPFVKSHKSAMSLPLQSDANASTTTTTTCSSVDTDELPRDYREMTMVASLRGMGFTISFSCVAGVGNVDEEEEDEGEYEDSG